MGRVRFYHHPRGFVVGALDVDITGAPGRMTIAAVGDTRADALHRAASIAERIANDPVMSALMPPQAQAAIAAAKTLAVAAKRGTRALRAVWGMFHGKGKKRLAAALHTEAVKHESTGDLGWNPFRRKRKRRVPPMRPVNRSAMEAQESEPDDVDDEQDGGEE